MDAPRGIILSELSQRKTNTIWYRLHVESNMIQMNLPTKQKQTHKENRLVVAKGMAGQGRAGLGVWD